MLLLICAKCGSKKLRFIKNQEAKRILSSLGISTSHLKQPGFTYSACGPFTKNKERIQKFKRTRNTNYIYKNELDKTCFQHDMVHGDFKDLAKRAASDKALRDKAFNITKNPKYDKYQRMAGFYGLQNFLIKILLQAVVSLIMTINKIYN